MEKQTTSIQPTIDGINALLSSFGFQGFSLAQAVNATSYKLVRIDGADAKTTLSEGEKTFVTFLYFYHLLKGSKSDSGIDALVKLMEDMFESAPVSAISLLRHCYTIATVTMYDGILMSIIVQ